MKTFGVKSVLLGHTKPVNAILKLTELILVSSSDDLTIKFWDLSTAQEINSYKGRHLTRINCIAIDRARGQLYSGSGDSTCKDNSIWKYDGSNQSHELILNDFRYPVKALAISDDNQLLFIGSNDILSIYDIEQMVIIRQIKAKCIVASFAFINNCEIIFTFVNCSAFAYDIKSNNERQIGFPGHFNKINGWQAFKTKNSLVTYSGDTNTFPQDYTIRIWNLTDKLQERIIYGFKFRITCWDIAENKLLLCLGSLGTVFFWRISNNRNRVYVIGKQRNEILTLSILHNEMYVIASDSTPSVSVWLIQKKLLS